MRRSILALVLVGLFVTWAVPSIGGPTSPAPAETQAAHGDEHADDGHGEGGGHASPVTPVLLGLVIMLLAAKLAGWYSWAPKLQDFVTRTIKRND